MCRLDYSPLGRKLETLDSGFAAYCGFIHIEAAHRNPIMLTMASYLYGEMKRKQHLTDNSMMVTSIERKREKNSSNAVRRWHLAVLLLRNPSLVMLRKSALAAKEDKKEKDMFEKKQRISVIEEMTHRPSLISESDFERMWQKKC
ncbi:unnamed protein product [Adineta ricciae]|uniref:Uncharacterized protein n=1 Tax=Adineta ricciae TaxID=249248 RepID=A0A816HPZ8_ADIRI|nr:unnamed protein product [Adineta ricciae]